MSLPPLVVLTHEFFPFRGGIAVYVEEAARAATATHAVTVWAPDSPELRTHAWPFAINPLLIQGTHGWRDRLTLARTLRAADARLAQSLVWLPEPGAILAAMYLNVFGRLPARRLVLTLHGSEILRFAGPPHRRLLFQRLLDRAARVGVVSRYVRDLLQRKFRVDAAKIVLVPGALRSDYMDTSVVRTRRPAGDAVVLLTVARVHPRKGQHVVLEALALVPPGRPLEYRIAGPIVRPSYQRQLEILARRSGATVRFLGEVPESNLHDLYAGADVFAMTPVAHGPSLEGFGLVFLEAAAHGLPTVAHRIGGVPEAVRDGVTGLLVDPTDRPALAAAIARLRDDPSLRARLAAGARERARERSWPDNARALFDNLA
jgi:phosphatidylinositol alpha-1,6-mannosyltransferase